MTEISAAKLNGVQSFLDWYNTKDSNKNGALDKTELSEQDFRSYDKNKNSSVSRQEIIKAEGEEEYFRESLGVARLNSSDFGFSLVLSKGQAIQNIFFEEDTKVWLDKKGRISLVQLSKDQMIKGIGCKAGTYAGLDEDGEMVFATLSKGQTIKGTDCKADIPIMFNKDGGIKELPSYPPPDTSKD